METRSEGNSPWDELLEDRSQPGKKEIKKDKGSYFERRADLICIAMGSVVVLCIILLFWMNSRITKLSAEMKAFSNQIVLLKTGSLEFTEKTKEMENELKRIKEEQQTIKVEREKRIAQQEKQAKNAATTVTKKKKSSLSKRTEKRTKRVN